MTTERTPGVFTLEQLESTPGYKMKEIEKRNKPYVLIECVEDIPCDPCETSCPTKAISVGDSIINLPAVDLDKCTGCGTCVVVCPGLAVFVVNPDVGGGDASLMIPYEYLPAPKVGSEVPATDRLGETVCMASVLKVAQPQKNNRTLAVTIKFPKQYINDVRGIDFRKIV